MSVKGKDTATLLKRIGSAFPSVDLPLRAEIAFHPRGCAQCADLVEDLEPYRGKDVDVSLIRSVYQEMPHLSAKAWRWLLPNYLRFCLTDEAVYSRMETEFLIYNLGPDLRFQVETTQRLSGLSFDQVSCLVEFLEWCLDHEYWSEYCPEDITKAIGFLKTSNRGQTAV